ncbi:MAG: hypothetical protein IPM38_07230 [Ignavibacteria bacterium]|nr:hypothetical protein [Ignavibacteria bacterium]
MNNKRLIIVLISVVILLLIPLIAMQFSDEVNWTAFDFLVMGILLTGAGLMCEFILRKVTKTGYKIVLTAAVVGSFLLIWIELAVGIFGTPFAGN